KTAQAQQKIAMDKAAEAVKAAGMEVKVSYDDDGKPTYRVGDVMIVPGAKKSTVTTNGKTVITGKIRDINSFIRSARKKVEYKPAEGDDAEVMAQPAVDQRHLTVGSTTDSADDTMRLYLVDKYTTSEAAKKDGTVSVYSRDSDPSVTFVGLSTVSEKAPHGTVSTGGKTYVIKRAEGVYYEVTGPGGTPRGKTVAGGGSANLDQFTVKARTKPDNTSVENGIYYYDDVDGRVWLKRVGVTTDRNDHTTGNTGIKYHYIKTPVHNVRFPATKSFEHLNYGVWAGLKEDGNTLADLGTGFVSKLPDGTVTPTGDMPNFGTATYEGGWTGNIRAKAADGNGAIDYGQRPMTTVTNFGDNTLTTTLDGLATLKGGIDGNSFSGTDVTVNAASIYELDNDGKFTGSFSGSFFGPKAEEIGGVFDITSEGRKAGEARGAFGGGMTASE
ncbi:transferrin-binding protein-like solute binding protein, partial [Nitratireductor sp. XY-223]|uniref:transferrin-binding protein-like solute binding protein n=1 Tax=Nitratireductor sp. XY-223 TaxID=2561926 RepID=UPI0010AAD289